MDIEQNNMIYNHLQEILTENNKLKIKSKQLQEQCNDLYSSGSATENAGVSFDGSGITHQAYTVSTQTASVYLKD